MQAEILRCAQFSLSRMHLVGATSRGSLLFSLEKSSDDMILKVVRYERTLLRLDRQVVGDCHMPLCGVFEYVIFKVFECKPRSYAALRMTTNGSALERHPTSGYEVLDKRAAIGYLYAR